MSEAIFDTVAFRSFRNRVSGGRAASGAVWSPARPGVATFRHKQLMCYTFSCKLRWSHYYRKTLIQPLSRQQMFFLIESGQLYAAWIDAFHRARAHRYGMKWVTAKGRQYLVRLHDARGNGKSLGPRNAHTEAIHAAFVQGKADADARYRQLSEKMAVQARLNRAARLGRVPRVVADILVALDTERALDDFCVIGTQALFAYEAMAGVQCQMDVLATSDVDLLFDARRPLSLVSRKTGTEGLLGRLRQADRSFRILSASPYRAVNKDGFMVDLVVQASDPRARPAVTFSEADLIAAEVPNLHWLVNAPKHTVVAIAAHGVPVRLTVPDPRAFALHKAWLCHQRDRDPLKKARDREQAVIVARLVTTHLPHLPFQPAAMKFFSADMVQAASAWIEDQAGVRFPKP